MFEGGPGKKKKKPVEDEFAHLNEDQKKARLRAQELEQKRQREEIVIPEVYYTASLDERKNENLKLLSNF